MFTVLMAFMWNSPFLLPFKVFVVFLHEISHGLGALVTGGVVKGIVVRWNESGLTYSLGGNFLAIATAGYIGSVIWGSLMLHSSLKGKYYVGVAIWIGSLFLFFTFFYLIDYALLTYVFGIFWGLLFIVTALAFKTINRLLLFFLGGLTSLYGIYDLSDFFRGEVLSTDAGIIASYYLENHSLRVALAYFIAILISLLAIWILYRIVMNSVQISKQEAEAENEMQLPEGLTPEMLAMFELMAQQKPPEKK